MSYEEKVRRDVNIVPAPHAQDDASQLDSNIEKRILRKLDFTLVPLLWILFVVSFVDRGNIGNALIQGMDNSLQLTGHEFNIAVTVFTIAYIVLGVPASLVFKRTGPKSLAVMMFLWGLCAIGQGLTRSYAGLVVCRTLMGAFEAGFVPGCAYLIGSYYKNDEFLRRYAVFFSGGTISGAFNGLLARLLAMADGAGGYEGWRWIFLVEGLITVGVAAATYFLIIPFPEENVTTFRPEEKKVLLERLRRDSCEAVSSDGAGHGRNPVLWVLSDWIVWMGMIAYFCALETNSSIFSFQPAVLKGLGYSAISAQVHTIPVYCTSFAVGLLCAWLSELSHQRYVFALFGALLTTAGLAVEIAVKPYSVHARYAGIYLISAGSTITMPTVVVWTAINVSKGFPRAVALGFVIAFGNAGALVSSNVFILKQSPVFLTGFGVGLGMACLGITSMTALFIGLLQRRRHNTEVVASREEQMETSGTVLQNNRVYL